ncbi:MAG: RNA 2',3'-cyclic phosphodiesterase [Gemmatimonadaceae bacterium]|nr:RNA 2',3'-cyclic phosphodiesterase [Gemmatimonadaceae bacterium]
MTGRLFVAVPLPPVVADALHAATAPLRAAAPSARWIEPEALHCTVRYLGPTDASRVADVVAAMTATVASARPLALEIRQFGAFPAWSRARVVWIGLTPDPKFELLHHDLETALMARGWEVEGRIFRPHITLARVETPDVAAPIRTAARGLRVRVPITVDHLALMQAGGESSGRRYAYVHSAHFGGVAA